MAYELEQWERDGRSGEARIRAWRTSLEDARQIVAEILTGTSRARTARITIRRTQVDGDGVQRLWDVYRGTDRDESLDCEFRDLKDLRKNPSQVTRRQFWSVENVEAGACRKMYWMRTERGEIHDVDLNRLLFLWYENGMPKVTAIGNEG